MVGVCFSYWDSGTLGVQMPKAGVEEGAGVQGVDHQAGADHLAVEVEHPIQGITLVTLDAAVAPEGLDLD